MFSYAVIVSIEPINSLLHHQSRLVTNCWTTKATKKQKQGTEKCHRMEYLCIFQSSQLISMWPWSNYQELVHLPVFASHRHKRLLYSNTWYSAINIYFTVCNLYGTSSLTLHSLPAKTCTHHSSLVHTCNVKSNFNNCDSYEESENQALMKYELTIKKTYIDSK